MAGDHDQPYGWVNLIENKAHSPGVRDDGDRGAQYYSESQELDKKGVHQTKVGPEWFWFKGFRMLSTRVVALSALTLTHAQACFSEEMTSRQLYDFCTSSSASQVAICVAYVNGVFDGIQVQILTSALALDKVFGYDGVSEVYESSGFLCVPDDLSGSHRAAIVTGYLDARPSVWDRSAAVNARNSFALQFQCDKPSR
jgi:hypothetical protein